MPTHLRTWNVFHGHAVDAGRRIGASGLLEEMCQRIAAPDPVTGEAPAVVLLQEVPPAALARLERWTGMRCVGAVTRRAALGPVPIPTELGSALTSLAPARLRSYVSGQANAVLLRTEVALLSAQSLRLNPSGFCRQSATLLGLDTAARLTWEREPRTVQLLSLRLPDGRAVRLAHLHATSFPSNPAVPDAEVARAIRLLDDAAAPGELLVLAGDLNVPPQASPAIRAFAARAGATPPASWIDHILVAGATASGTPVTWPDERRRTTDGLLLSDHAPVEVTIA
jgi:endonuclease/exonuclease/phosphatase family metal-dependent hydrolase